MVLIALCAAVLASELLVRHTRARVLGSALVVILICAVLANLGVIPAGSTPERSEPTYDAIFTWVAPLAIFWLLLQVELRRVLQAGLPMLSMFLVGSAGVVLGALLAVMVLGIGDSLAARLGPVSGMYVGTYVGGSINFNAIALHYNVQDHGVLFAGAVVVDNIVSTTWMVVTLVLPRLLERGPQRRLDPAPGSERIAMTDGETVEPATLAAMLALGLGAVVLSQVVAERTGLPAILALTILALSLAQLPMFTKRWLPRPFAGARALGMFAVYLFLGVVGAHCDLPALAHSGRLGIDLFLLATVIVSSHGIVIFGVGRLFRVDPAVTAIASQANVGGGTTALALARGLDRDDLVVPGILCGSIGNALGTFLGLWVAGLIG